MVGFESGEQAAQVTEAGVPPRSIGGRLRRAVARLTFTRLAVVLSAALLLGLVVSYGLLLRSGDAGWMQTDFLSYYSGAHFVLAGHAGSMYDFNALGGYERRLVAPLHVRDGVLPYVYPPFLALALAPLAALPYGAAFSLWVGINLLALAVTLRLLAGAANLDTDGRLVLWVAGPAFLPVFVAVAQGQTSILILAALAVTGWALLRERPLLAGSALALVLVKPPYALPFLLVLLARRQGRALLAFVAVAGALVALPTLVFGTGVDAGYIATLQKALGWKTQFGYAPVLNHSVAGFVGLLGGGAAATGLVVAIDVALLVTVAWCAWQAPDMRAPLALAGIVALLVAPHVLIHDLSLLLLPVVLAASLRSRRSRSLRAVVAIGYAATVAGLPLAGSTHVQASVPAMTALAIWILMHFRPGERSRATEATGPSPARRLLLKGRS